MGPAYQLRIPQATIMLAIAAASINFRRGMVSELLLQNRRMPTRTMAIKPATPEIRTAAVRIQAFRGSGDWPEALSAAVSKDSLATKPDRGGRPTISKAQA